MAIGTEQLFIANIVVGIQSPAATEVYSAESNNLVTFRSFVFPPDVGERNENTETIS